MTTQTTFTYKSKYSTYNNCRFSVNRYHNDNFALQIVDNEGLIATCTVNLGKVETSDFVIAIKDYSENEGMVDFLKSMGIIEDKPKFCEYSGFVTIPYYALTESGKELYKDI
jgi:hypothetical protein